MKVVFGVLRCSDRPEKSLELNGLAQSVRLAPGALIGRRNKERF